MRTERLRLNVGVMLGSLLGCNASGAQSDFVGTCGKIETEVREGRFPIGEEMTTVENGYRCVYKRISQTATPETFIAFDPNSSTLFPCQIIQGKTLNEVFAEVPLARQEVAIVLTIVSGAEGTYSMPLIPTVASATEKQNEILRSYKGGTPASLLLGVEQIYSSKQLEVTVKASAKWLGGNFSTALGIKDNDNKTRVLVQFVQRAFSMACSGLSAETAFAPSVTVDQMRPYMGPGNPPVYLGSVTYGRMFFFMFETSKVGSELETAVQAAVRFLGTGVSGQVDAKSVKELRESQLRTFALGGDAQAVVDAARAEAKDDPLGILRLVWNARFSPQNPMVPISLSAYNLIDSNPVRLALTTEYTAKDCEPIAQAPPPPGPNYRTAGPMQTLGPWGGCCGSGVGGQAFTTFCTPGSVAIGVRGNSGRFVDAISLICAKLRPDGTLYDREILPRQGGFGGGPYELICPEGSVITDLSGGYGWHIDHVAPSCTPVKDIPAGTGTGLPIGTAGPTTGSKFVGQCPKGMALVGIGGRASPYLNSLQLFCQAIQK